MTYGALSLLEGECAPTLRGRAPYWTPKPPLVTRQVWSPAWSWRQNRKWQPGAEITTLDVNAAYLAAASSVTLAHGALLPVRGGGDFANYYAKSPGFYMIDFHEWMAGLVVSPLGGITRGDLADHTHMWVAHPTLELLDSLSRDGYWPEVEIRAAFICREKVSLRKWAEKVRDDRAAVINRMLDNPADDDARARYEEIKTGYAVAVQMLLTPPDKKGTPPEQRQKKNRAYRPDWTMAIWAQHAANTWRKAWRAALVGCSPVAMGSVDELTFLREDFEELGCAERTPFRLDNTGQTLGSLKVKSHGVIPDASDEELRLEPQSVQLADHAERAEDDHA